MSAIGLPGDIWIEILKHLPNSTLFKTCLLNSALLELSLDFLYSDISLSTADKGIEQSFKLLIRDQYVARRLRRLQVVAPGPGRPLSAQLKKFNQRLVYLEDLRRDFSNVPRGRISLPLEDYTQKTIHRYKISNLLESQDEPGHNQISLSNLVDLRVSVPDETMDFDVLQKFLVPLWKTGAIGASLRTLMFEASGFDMALLLLPTIRSAAGCAGRTATNAPAEPTVKSPLRNVTSLTIRLSHSSKTSNATAALLHKTLRQLLERLPSLTHFSIHCILRADYPEPWTLAASGSTVPQIDLSTIIKDLPFLSGLKTIRYNAPFTDKSLSDPEVLTNWLRRYQDQLQGLVIEPVCILFLPESITDDEADTQTEEEEESGSSASSDGSPEPIVSAGWRRRRHGPSNPLPGPRYAKWVSDSNSGFAALRFRCLKRIEIQPCSTPVGPLSIPSFRDFAPSLTSMTILNRWLTWTDLQSIEGFRRDGSCRDLTPEDWNWGLEMLDVSLRYLTPSILELLHQRLPHLRRLTLRYLSIGLNEKGPGLNRLNPTEFIVALHNKKLPHWKFTYLRISGITTRRCLSTHPVLEVMQALASCLSTVPVLDTEKPKTCRC